MVVDSRPRPAPRPINVELVTAPRRTSTVPSEPVNPTPPRANAQPDTPPTQLDPTLSPLTTVGAGSLRAKAILSDAKNRELRRTLGTLESSERLTQLCNVEGIEQLRQARPRLVPDSISAAAFAETVVRGLTIQAPAAAFRAERKWYRLSFECSVAADYLSVKAYSFRVGDPIPEDQWEAHDLIAEDDDE